jgi:lipopolysaccharide assembly protein A
LLQKNNYCKTNRQGLNFSMMRALGWAVKILVFIVVLGFALKNSQPVILHYFFGYVWEAPLIVLMLAAFTLGVLLGVLALLPLIYRLRRERSNLRKQADAITNIVPPHSSSPG